MRRASPLRGLIAVLLLLAVLWAAAAPGGSHSFAFLVPLWLFFAIALPCELVHGSRPRADGQPLELLARLAPRAPPAA